MFWRLTALRLRGRGVLGQLPKRRDRGIRWLAVERSTRATMAMFGGKIVFGGKVTWVSRSFIRKRMISLVTTTSLAAMSLVMAHGPTSAHRNHQTMPIQYVADWHEDSDEAPFLSENESAMKKMMADMRVKPTGDVDRDFVAMMVPHHQGAVDMAKAELGYGHNEVLRQLAQEIVTNQGQEISVMRRAVGGKLPPSAASPTQPAPSSGPSSVSPQMMRMSPDAMGH
jgi:hypothetical protein